MLRRGTLRKSFLLIALSLAAGLAFAQDSSDKSWTSTTGQSDPNGTLNPMRTRTTHTEINGRIIDKTFVETLGPDGRYVPFSETERESVRVNDTTTRQTERTYGQTPDGQRTLTQQTQEETRTLPAGEKKSVSTTSNPDADGRLQVVRRALSDSKQLSPDVRDTKTTIYSQDATGNLAPAVQIDERETKADAATTQFTKSTSLADAFGNWTLSEIRKGTTKQDGGQTTKQEEVLRPDFNGKMSVIERTVTKSASSDGEQRATTETYSTNVPGEAGDDSLQLVKRETTVQRPTLTGRSTSRQVESANPGDPSAGLQVTQQAIDIVRPTTNGAAQQTTTIRTADANGQLTTVWVDMGKTDNPAVVNADTKPAARKPESRQKK